VEPELVDEFAIDPQAARFISDTRRRRWVARSSLSLPLSPSLPPSLSLSLPLAVIRDLKEGEEGKKLASTSTHTRARAQIYTRVTGATLNPPSTFFFSLVFLFLLPLLFLSPSF